MTLAVLGLAAGAVDYDLNGDGVVDRLDYNLLAARIASTTAGYDSRYDLDGNGSIDAHDANLLLSLENYGGTTTFTVNGVSFKMVAVQGGTFTMGATAEQGSEAESDENPAHQVTLSSYCIGQTEVTQELWLAVMGSNPSYFQASTNSDYGTNLQRPVEQVSWIECPAFISKLNQMTGKNFRLPTEAEWEYAARGGNRSQGYKYAGSNNVDDVAWHTGNSSSTTHTVATKAPNELGIYDMSGNVYEWCQDRYGSYSSSAQTNPTGPATGSYRVARGGCLNNLARHCRVSSRRSGAQNVQHTNHGLRLAL